MIVKAVAHFGGISDYAYTKRHEIDQIAREIDSDGPNHSLGAMFGIGIAGTPSRFRIGV
jgi:hypothetical protein